MSVLESQGPETPRRPWNRTLHAKHSLYSQEDTRWMTTGRSTTDGFRSLGLEAFAAFSVGHDCLEEREEALRVLPRFHGAYLVLREARMVSDEMGSKG